MKVRFVRAWQLYKVGDVITPAALLRGWLVSRKLATPVVEVPRPPLQPVVSVTARDAAGDPVTIPHAPEGEPKRGYRVSRASEAETTSGGIYEIAVSADKPLPPLTLIDPEKKDPAPAGPPRQPGRPRRNRGDL